METDRAPRANADRSAGSDGDVDMMFARIVGTRVGEKRGGFPPPTCPK